MAPRTRLQPAARQGLAPVAARDGDTRHPKDVKARRTHRERVRASAAWALDEYATTLAKLAK